MRHAQRLVRARHRAINAFISNDSNAFIRISDIGVQAYRAERARVGAVQLSQRFLTSMSFKEPYGEPCRPLRCNSLDASTKSLAKSARSASSNPALSRHS